jgi:hypothetical protein
MLLDWRDDAKRVGHACTAWSSADRRERQRLYGSLLEALTARSAPPTSSSASSQRWAAPIPSRDAAAALSADVGAEAGADPGEWARPRDESGAPAPLGARHALWDLGLSYVEAGARTTGWPRGESAQRGGGREVGIV